MFELHVFDVEVISQLAVDYDKSKGRDCLIGHVEDVLKLSGLFHLICEETVTILDQTAYVIHYHQPKEDSNNFLIPIESSVSFFVVCYILIVVVV